MNSQARVLLVDDHPLVLEGVKRILENIAEIATVITTSSYAEAVLLAKSHSYDLYIIDIELPDGDGFVLISEIRASQPEAKIIVNTMHDELWTIRKLINMNVNGVVLKTSDVVHMNQAIHTVLEGKTYYCRHFSQLSSGIDAIWDTEENQKRLTPREDEVLRAIVAGCSTVEIAHKLFLSVNTIESHRRKLFLKLDARNMADLVAKAIRYGIVPIK